MENKKYISELITEEEISKWKQGEFINIIAGTGKGKSHFVKNTLYGYCLENNKKALMLLPRKTTKNQFQSELVKNEKLDGTIKFMSYQSIESFCEKNVMSMDLDVYDYIICDESQYFFADSSFNIKTDLSLNSIINSKAIKIFMSADGYLTSVYLKDIKGLEVKDYDFGSKLTKISSMKFFDKEETIEVLIDKFLSSSEYNKAIIFYNNVKKANELYKKYKDVATFCCSDSNKEYADVNEYEIAKIINKEKFDSRLLITTSCLDVGLNIKDNLVTDMIIANVNDPLTVKQMIGRKRLLNNEYGLTVYIQNISGQKIGGYYSTMVNKLNKGEDFKKVMNKEMSLMSFNSKYMKKLDKYNIVYNITLDENGTSKQVLNELAFYNCRRLKYSYERINQLSKKYKKRGFAVYICQEFGIDFGDIIGNLFIKEDENIESGVTLEQYLDSIVDKRLDKEQQKQLVNRIDYRVDGHQKKTYSQLNNALKDTFGDKYIIIPKKSGGVRYWIVNKID